MVYTEEHRKYLAINILCSLRENTMGRSKEVIGNIESALTILVAPDSFLDAVETHKVLTDKRFCRTRGRIWEIIKQDIKELFPGQFTSEQLGE